MIATIAAIAIALVGFEAVLLIGAAPKPTGTIAGAQVRFVDEGSTSVGLPWFGTQVMNYTGPADGYPYAYAPGSTFNFSIQPANHDNASHTLSSVLVNSPFTVVRCSPTLPYEVDAGEDFLLIVTVGAPPSMGTYALNLTVVVAE